jgi:actin, other eukaryote
MKKPTCKEELKIVIDNGSGFMKAGIAGEETPKTVFSTTIGRLTKKFEIEKEFFIGEEVQLKKNSFPSKIL